MITLRRNAARLAVLLFSTPPDSIAIPTTTSPPVMDMGWLLFKTILWLVLIIAMILGLVFVLRKYMGHRLPGAHNQQWFQVLAKTSLQPKQSLLLVKVLDRVLLLGVTDSTIQTLAEFDETPELREIAEAASAKTPGLGNTLFKKLMQQQLEREDHGRR